MSFYDHYSITITITMVMIKTSSTNSIHRLDVFVLTERVDNSEHSLK